MRWPAFMFGIGLCWASSAAAQQPAATGRTAAPPTGFRKLAPGVETTVPLPIDPHDTVSYHNMVELLTPGVVPELDWTPKTMSESETVKSRATDRAFRTTVWYLQFTFKPLRLIEVDLPGPGGRLERKVVWYLVYRVKNIGNSLQPAAEKPAEEGAPPAGAPAVEVVDSPGYPIHCFPHFSLEAKIEGSRKVYHDELIPLALDPIRRREDPNRKFENSVSLGKLAIPLSTATDDQSVYGIATWVDVDPRIDFFAIYISGLTNAYRWTDPPGAFKAGDPPATGRKFSYKTLQLNFWRPGDEFRLLEDEIMLGAPADTVNKPANPDEEATAPEAGPPAGSPSGRSWDKIIDYRWVFR